MNSKCPWLWQACRSARNFVLFVAFCSKKPIPCILKNPEILFKQTRKMQNGGTVLHGRQKQPRAAVAARVFQRGL
jgi:hypothetical protein